VKGFVSGILCRATANSGQGPVFAVHVCLGPPQQVPHLRAQFAIRVPARRSCLQTDQGLGDVSVRSASLRSVERLQGAVMQQR